MNARARTTCPTCHRDVATRRDGTPRTHNPPPGRDDLKCAHHNAPWDTHCRGSHETPQREVLKVRVIGSPAAVERFTAAIRDAPGWRVTHSDLANARPPGHVRLYMDLEAHDAL